MITASNELSIAEGYHIFADNEDFRRYFGRFCKKYGVDCLIRGVFASMEQQDKQKYMKIVHQYLMEDYRGSHVMKNLLALIGGKDYFIVTSNADTHFQMNGFDSNWIFEVEGNFDSLSEQSDAWNAQRERFMAFIKGYSAKSVVLFELSIGARNQLIKAPTMQIAAKRPSWKCITMNMPAEIHIPEHLAGRAIALTGDIEENFIHLIQAA